MSTIESTPQTVTCNECGHTEATLGAHNQVSCSNCARLLDERNKAILKFLMDEHLQRSYHLIYVSYDDCIEDNEVIEMIVKDDYENLWSRFDQFEMESRDDGVQYHMEELERIVNGEDRFGDDAWSDFQYTEEYDELRYAIEERDDSDWLGDLVRNSHRQWFSYDLDFTVDDHDPYAEADEDEVDSFVNELAAHLNVRLTDDLSKKLRQVYENLPGANLHLFWSGDLSDVYTGRDDNSNFLRIKDTHITDLHTGWEVEIDAEILVPFKRDNLDHTSARYYGDDVCGMVKSAFEANPKFITITPEEAAIEATKIREDLNQ